MKENCRKRHTAAGHTPCGQNRQDKPEEGLEPCFIKGYYVTYYYSITSISVNLRSVQIEGLETIN